MEIKTQASRGIFSLPNELLLRVFDLFNSREVIALTPVCRNFHCLALRVTHNRLQIAGGLAGHTLYLDCHHPAARTPDGKLLCDAPDTDGLQDLLDGIHDGDCYLGQVKQVFNTYTRFKPQRRAPETSFRRWVVPGDIPGSRTYQTTDPQQAPLDPHAAVTQHVTIDAHEIFSQLSTLAYLDKRDFVLGPVFHRRQVSEGHIRIWRNWLSDQCESKRWTDGEPIVVHHDVPITPTVRGRARKDSVTSCLPPGKDPSILWVDSRDENVGIKFRVRERIWRRSAPGSYSSDIECAVSYLVELEEIVVRTSHLVLKLEEVQEMIANETGKVIVFGRFSA